MITIAASVHPELRKAPIFNRFLVQGHDVSIPVRRIALMAFWELGIGTLTLVGTPRFKMVAV